MFRQRLVDILVGEEALFARQPDQVLDLVGEVDVGVDDGGDGGRRLLSRPRRGGQGRRKVVFGMPPRPIGLPWGSGQPARPARLERRGASADTASPFLPASVSIPGPA